MSLRSHKRADEQGARLLAILAKCAREGRGAPTNSEMAALLRIKNAPTASKALQRLEARGEVTVVRFRDSRVVTITATGESTAAALPPTSLNADAAAGADDQPQGNAASVARAKPEPLRVDRDPCTFCGVRADIGCRHSRAALRLASVPVFRHFSEVARG